MLRVLTVFGLMIVLFSAAMPVYGGSADQRHDARDYVLEMCANSSVLFLGTTHKQPVILSMMADILPHLVQAGVTHLALEIATDQQKKIDAFFNGVIADSEIELAEAIDCPQYRHLLKTLKALPADQRPAVRAVDLPLERYAGPVTRDEWIADQLDRLLQMEGTRKIVVLLGSLHVFRHLDWESVDSGGHLSIRSKLALRHPDTRLNSIINIIGAPDSTCDFGRRFSDFDIPVAFDLDARFAGWSLGVSQLMAIVPAEPWMLAEGVIIY